jgi:integrase
MTLADVLEIPKAKGKYGEGSLVQRGTRWQISFYDAQGRRRRESFSTLKKAEKQLTARLALRDAGRLEPYEGRIAVTALAESYKVYAKNSVPKSYVWIEYVWRLHLEPFFGDLMAVRVTSDHLQGYIRERLAAGVCPSTINRELTVLKAIFNLGVKADPPKLIRAPRFPEKLREPNARSGFINDDQYALLQAKCKHPWLRAALAVLYNFGFRKSELMGLRVSQVDLDARTIRLLPGTTKSDKGRVVVMPSTVLAMISECVKGKAPDDKVFTWENGRPVKDFRGAWEAMTKAAGLPNLLVHDLRRSAVRRMLRRGISKHVARRISGHATDAIFDRYDITDETDLADAAGKLENAEIGRKLDTQSAEPMEARVNY